MGQLLSKHKSQSRSKLISSDLEESKSGPDAYLAKPSGSCCLKGTIHKGEGRGRRETIANVETYISVPPASKANGNVLLYFPDVWGMFPNGLLVMDAFASAGYTVLGLDYFRGVRISAFSPFFFSILITFRFFFRVLTERSFFRIPYGNIARIGTIKVIRGLTTRLGKENTLRSLTRRCRDGWLLSSIGTGKKTQGPSLRVSDIVLARHTYAMSWRKTASLSVLLPIRLF